MEPAALAAQKGGLATWGQLRAGGASAHAIWMATRAGQLERIGWGRYARPDADPAMVAAVQSGQVLAGPSAALFHGLPVLNRPTAPVLAAGPRKDTATTLLRTVVDCALLLPGREALAVADAALRRGLTHRELDLAALREPAAREVAALADPRADSLIESVVRWCVAALGVGFDLQVRIPGVGRVDLVLDGWLVVETDGFEFHRDRAAYRRDRRRWSMIAANGLAFLVLTYEDAVAATLPTMLLSALDAPRRR